MKKIDPHGKTCIYLDQFVVSNLVDCPNPLWTEIKTLMEARFAEGKVYSPLSMTHFIETVKKTPENARLHDQYFRTLSDGFFFRDELFMTSQLISSLIRKNNRTVNTFLQKVELKDMDSFYASLNSRNRIFDESIISATAPVNQLRKAITVKAEKTASIASYDVIIALHVQQFIARLQEYLNARAITIRPDTVGPHAFPNWIDQLLYQLTNKHKFTGKLLQQLLLELRANGFRNIPPLHIRHALFANIAVKQKQETASDHIDVIRLSNGLVAADILFTDKKRKHEIKELGLDIRYGTEVFSGTVADLETFKEYLQGI